MKSLFSLFKENAWIGWTVFVSVIVGIFLLGLLAASIIERRSEGLIAYTPATGVSEWEPRNEKWGEHFPREYETYLKTREMDFESKYSGNTLVDMLEEDPRLVVLWAGYGFAKDYNQGRGHYYAVEDIRNSLRTGAPMSPDEGPMPNTCWACKSPDVARVMAEVGPEEFYKGKWASRGSEIVNHIGCADCHDPETMDLRISRPALTEAFERRGEDISNASHQEKRSLVCAQCHVEYYFKGPGKYLTFPWDKGFSAEDMEAYYDSYEFADWTHALSKAPMLKAQHPGWEVFKTGIHAKRGLACADCHMPYVNEGGVKYTNHHMVSPLKYIETTCQVCHRESEEELRNNVYERQEKNFEIRDQVEDSLVRAHIEAKAAWEAGANEDQMKPILQLIRHAQWRWDFAVASHGSSFHAPLEVARLMASALNKSQEARLALSRIFAAKGRSTPVEMPDISSKEAAQQYIGLDAEKMKEDKQRFLDTIVPKWKEEAQKREESWG